MKRLLATLLTLLTLASMLASCESPANTDGGSSKHTDTKPPEVYQTVAQVEIEQNVKRLEPDPNEWVVKYLEIPDDHVFEYDRRFYFDEEKQTLKGIHSLDYPNNKSLERDPTRYAAEYDLYGNLISDTILPYTSDKVVPCIKLTDYGYMSLTFEDGAIALNKYFEETGELVCVIDDVFKTATYSLANADIHEDSDGNYYVTAYFYDIRINMFVVLSSEGETLFKYETDEGMRSIDGILEYDGVVYIVDIDDKYWHPDLKTQELVPFEVPDLPDNISRAGLYNLGYTKITSRPTNITIIHRENGAFIPGDENYSAYYAMPNAVYGHKADSPSAEPILFLEASGLTNESISIHKILSPTCIFADVKNLFAKQGQRSSEINKPAMIYFDDTREVATRQVLTLAHTDQIDSTFRTAVAYFNMTNPNYRIETVDYTSYDDPVAQIEKEFGAGKYPDMMILPSIGMDFTNLTAKGFIANLVDLGFNADSIAPSVRSAIEYGGGIYRLPMTFEYDALINRDGIESMTLGDLISLYEKHGNSLFRQLNQNTLWRYLVSAGILADFIDYGNAECSFDDERFIQLLEFIKSYNNVVDSDSINGRYTSDLYNEMISGEGVFLHSEYRYFIGELPEYEYFYGEGEYSISGFPTGGGSGIIISPYNEICVMKAAASPEGAMEFIDLLYSSNESRNYFWKDYLRTNYEFQTGYMRELLTYKDFDTYFDTTRNYISRMHLNGTSKKQDNPAYVYFEIGDDALDYFIERIFDAEVRPVDDVGLLGILDDELTTYLGGQGDARGTAARVQSRARIYLSERYG